MDVLILCIGAAVAHLYAPVTNPVKPRVEIPGLDVAPGDRAAVGRFSPGSSPARACVAPHPGLSLRS